MMPFNDQRKGDWILLPSGTEFYVLDPRAEEIHISDIAHNLANNCRFHGSCRKHYSVAEHSLYVAYLLRHEPIVTQLQALLHDATEAYLPDLAPQVKVAIPQFKTLEECLWKEICRRFGLPPVARV
jgi:5'-deoxynucleotidase YfbR-like HD superfamily hydrolase